MTPLELIGLKAESPMGTMAAYGLIRILDRYCHKKGLTPPRLGWSKESSHALLYLPDEGDRHLLEDCLRTTIECRQHSPVMNWKPDLKVSKDEYRLLALDQQKHSEFSENDYSDDTLAFLAAFGCELIRQRGKDVLKTSPLSMTSGQQRFLQLVKHVVLSLNDHQVLTDKIDEGLFQPWCYLDSVHMMGWDPASERQHAYQAESPTKQKPKGVMLAIWLAFEALPLFPTMAVSRRLATCSFVHKARTQHMIWPVWQCPITLCAIQSILTQLSRMNESLDLRQLGITGIYTSHRMPVGDKGYAVFKPSRMEGLR